jgi:hypothetical protein
MALTTAQRQARWKAKRDALARNHPDVVEGALLQEAERAEHGELSDEERASLANKLSDLAMHHLWRAQELAAKARKLKPPDWTPPGFPR